MSLLHIGTSGLITSQSALATTGHNITNVNTEGYSRQRVNQATQIPNFQGTHYIGSGVTVDSVQRLYDDFLADQARTYNAQKTQNEAYATLSGQVDNILGSTSSSLSEGFQQFFSAVNGVVNEPTSIAARQVLLSEGETIANRFRTLDGQLTRLDQELDNDIQTSIEDINSISVGIAELNTAIVELSSAQGDGAPNDLLDQRDALIDRLSSFISVSTIEADNGALNVFVGSGQSLVVGNTQVNLTTTSDTTTDPPRLRIGYSSSNIDINSQITGGVLGGALQVRAEVIDETRRQLDAIAQGLIDSVNEVQQQGVTLDGNVGANFFGPVPPDTTVADAGTIFLALDDPLDIAAAFPARVDASNTVTGTGDIDITQIDETAPITIPLLSADISFTYDAANTQYTVTDGTNNTVIPYDPAVDSGKTVNLTAPFAALTIQVAGVPDNGDTFTITNNSAQGDNRNAQAMLALQNAKLLTGGTESFGDAYDVLITDVATKTSRATTNGQTQQGLLDQITERLTSISEVNLDEEAANILRFQQSYQAASQIITVSNTVFNSLISAL